MEVTTCNHTTRIEQAADSGIEIGECSKCHMKRQYDRRGAKTIVQLIKLGRIDGKIVLPLPEENLLLSEQETAELKAAKKAHVIIPAALEPEATTTPARPEEKKTRDEVIADTSAIIGTSIAKGIQDREEPKASPTKSPKRNAKKCGGCFSLIIHEGQEWCISKRCPHRYPASVRPPYRRAFSTKVPDRPHKRSLMPQYFEKQREAILQDYRTLPLKEFFPRWHLTTLTWMKLKAKWEVKGKASSASSDKIIAPPDIIAVSDAVKEALPQFPAFDEKWPAVVQVEWIKAFIELKKLEASAKSNTTRWTLTGRQVDEKRDARAAAIISRSWWARLFNRRTS